MRSAVLVEIALPAKVYQENDWWIANCPAVDVCSQGPTRDEALVNLEDAVVFFIESCLERGTLFEVLREAGFERVAEEDVAGEPEGEPTVSVRVPLPFVIAERENRANPAQQR